MQKTECKPIWQGDTPLSKVKAGERYAVTNLDPTVVSTMGKLGIIPGAELKVESIAPFHGPIMVKVGSALYAVDAGMAEHITVKGEIEATIALLGNPNSGKSTIFRALTGLDIETANYAGTTVEVNRAVTEHHGRHLVVMDLPGTYSLGGDAPEEIVVREALQGRAPDALMVVLDALNLARNLFLLLQIIEWGYPVSVALNFSDLARKRHLVTDEGKLSEILGIPVIKTTATTGDGLDELMHTLDCPGYGNAPKYSPELEEWINSLVSKGFTRTVIMAALDGDALDPEAERVVNEEGDRFLTRFGERPEHRLVRERHGSAGMIASQIQTG
jgi:ferrous iron transport protein B